MQKIIKAILVFMLLLPTGTALANDQSLSQIKQRGEIIVGMDIPYGVMEFYDQAGNLTGIDVDIANEIANVIGVKAIIRNIRFADLFDAANNGEVDIVISAVTITLERQKKLLFSVPYLDAGLSIAIREDNQQIHSVQDLRGKRVGIIKGTTGEKLAKDSEFINNYVLFDKNDTRIEALIAGEIDAAIVHFLTTNKPMIKTVGEPLNQAFYGVVSKLNNNALMDEINKILRKIKRSERLNTIKRKYLPVN